MRSAVAAPRRFPLSARWITIGWESVGRTLFWCGVPIAVYAFATGYDVFFGGRYRGGNELETETARLYVLGKYLFVAGVLGILLSRWVRDSSLKFSPMVYAAVASYASALALYGGRSQMVLMILPAVAAYSEYCRRIHFVKLMVGIGLALTAFGVLGVAQST